MASMCFLQSAASFLEAERRPSSVVASVSFLKFSSGNFESTGTSPSLSFMTASTLAPSEKTVLELVAAQRQAL